MSLDASQDNRIAALERRIVALESHLGITPEAVPDVLIAEVHELIRRGNKIGAIKLVRELEGSGLVEAKARVEGIAARM
jgi:ribosomal protein L7/L12